MKITLEKSTISAALSKVAGICPSRSTIPILQNIKLSARNGILYLTASDMEITAYTHIQATVEQEGDTTLPAAALSDICKKSASDTVALTVTGDKATISGGRSRFTLGALPAEDYPHDMTISHDVAGMTMKASELLNIIDKTLPCVSVEETRHYLGGIFMHTDEGTLNAVATDGNRLAHLTLADMGSISSVLTPRKAMAQLAKMFDGAEDVTVRTSENKVAFASERMTVVSKLVDGQFPDYQRIIPRTFLRTFKVSSVAMREAIDRVAVARDDRTGAIRVSLTAGTLTVTARSKSDEAVDTIDCEYTGEDFDFGVNSQYLHDTLRSAGDCTVTFQCGDIGQPLRITADGQDAAQWIVMPMRIL